MSGSLSPQASALAEQGIRWVAITWVNHAGSTLVKVVPLSALDAAIGVGVGFSPVADAFRADGGIDPAHSLVRPDGDLRLRADATALALLEPASGWAWAPGERFEQGGGAYASDQRHACRREQEQLVQSGIQLKAGFELEWLVAIPDGDGDPSPALPGGPYGADRLVEGLDYASALLEALEAAGLPWLQFHPEYGPAQFELSLAPGTAIQAADRLVQAKLVIQRVSRRFGWHCSFSPKPCLEQVGNGGHLHLSVERDGVPLLQGGRGPGGLSEAGEGILAALLQELPALTALACPLAISYLRLAPSTWAAPYQVWGIENREAALRLIPAGPDGSAAHLELKVVDLASNPYLLLAAVQAVVQEGLRNPRPLVPPVAGDPSHEEPDAAPRLPATLSDASAAFAGSELLSKALGEPLHRSLLDSQSAENRRSASLTATELAASNAWWPVVGGLP